MQLLHCYDVVSRRNSPWKGLFTEEDWEAFEQPRDGKTFFSGYAAKHSTGQCALSWLVTALNHLKNAAEGSAPLCFGFAHREEVLCLCVLLGLGGSKMHSPPPMGPDRSWRVSEMVPYLGHVGLEAYLPRSGRVMLRVLLNGVVVKVLPGDSLKADVEGGSNLEDISRIVDRMKKAWEDRTLKGIPTAAPECQWRGRD